VNILFGILTVVGAVALTFWFHLAFRALIKAAEPPPLLPELQVLRKKKK